MLTTRTGKYVAQTGIASSPEALASGAALQALLKNLRAEEVLPFLKQFGLETIDPHQWYPQQMILDINKIGVATQINGGESLVAIGMKFIDTMPFPPQVTTIEAAVEALNRVMASFLRNVPTDEKITIGEQRHGYIKVIANLPYQPDVIYGYFWAIAKRFRPAHSTFAVLAVDNPDSDENPGKAFEITWSE